MPLITLISSVLVMLLFSGSAYPVQASTTGQGLTLESDTIYTVTDKGLDQAFGQEPSPGRHRL